MRKIVRNTIKIKEFLFTSRTNTMQKRFQLKPGTIGEVKIRCRNEVQNFLVRQMSKEKTTQCGPGNRYPLTNICTDTEWPNSLVHHSHIVFVAVQGAKLRCFTSALCNMFKGLANRPPQIKVLAVVCASEIELGSKKNPAIIIDLLEDIRGDEQGDQIIDRRLRRAHALRDFNRPLR